MASVDAETHRSGNLCVCVCVCVCDIHGIVHQSLLIKVMLWKMIHVRQWHLNLLSFMFYVPVTVHREQSLKREYQQDATIQMFIVNFRCLLLFTTVSTWFGHHYAHHQENKDRVLLHMVFVLVVLDVAGSGFVMLRCRVWALWRLLFEQ